MMVFLNEVKEQPAALEALLKEEEAFRKKAREFRPKRVLFSGMGASFYAGSFTALYLRSRGVDAECRLLSDLIEYDAKEILNGYDIFVLISQSGETVELLRFLELFEPFRNKSILVTNNPSSTSARFFSDDRIFLIQAGEEKSMGSSKTFTNTLTSLLIISCTWTNENLPFHVLPQSFEKYLALPIDGLSESFERAEFNILISWGYGVFISKMAQLTIAEVSKIPTLVYSGPAFRHGPIELLARNVNLILLYPGHKEEKRFKSLYTDLLEEGRLPWIIGDIEIKKNENERTIFIDQKLPDVLLPVPYVCIFQRLANLLAKNRGYLPGVGIFGSKVTRKE